MFENIILNIISNGLIGLMAIIIITILGGGILEQIYLKENKLIFYISLTIASLVVGYSISII